MVGVRGCAPALQAAIHVFNVLGSESRMQRNGIGACMPRSKAKVEIDESALLDVALQGMKENDFSIRCPSCESEVLISSGEGKCEKCGQLFKVGDSIS